MNQNTLRLLCAAFFIGSVSFAKANQPIRSVPVAEPVVALTFDDGPHAKNTDAVLEILDRHDTKATFFLIGSMVQSQPEAAKRIADAGHEIGNHTFAWENLTELESTLQIEYQILNAQIAITQATGVTPKYFRPPYLAQDSRTSDALSQIGLISVSANRLGNDWVKGTTSAQIVESITDGIGYGDIILLHEPEPNAVAALDEIISRLKAQGIRFVTISELLSKRSR